MRIRHPATVGLLIGVTAVIAVALLFSNRPTNATSSATVPLVEPIAVKTEPSLNFRRFETEDVEHYAVLEFANPTTNTVYFYGYGPEYPQQWFERRTKDQWTDCGWQWCGTGMELRELAAGEAFEFNVSLAEYSDFLEPIEKNLLDHKEPLRVGINYGFEKDTIETRLWCKAIDLTRVGQP